MKHVRIEDHKTAFEDAVPKAFVFSLALSLLAGIMIWAGALWLVL